MAGSSPNKQHLNQITLHTTSGIVRMIQPHNQLFQPIQVQGQNQMASIPASPSRQLTAVHHGHQQQLQAVALSGGNVQHQPQQAVQVSMYPQQLIRRTLLQQQQPKSITGSSGQIKLIATGSGGAVQAVQGVQGVGQQYFVSMPHQPGQNTITVASNSQHQQQQQQHAVVLSGSSEGIMVPSGLPEHALPGNQHALPSNLHALPSNQHSQLAASDASSFANSLGQSVILTSSPSPSPLNRINLQGQFVSSAQLMTSGGQLMTSAGQLVTVSSGSQLLVSRSQLMTSGGQIFTSGGGQRLHGNQIRLVNRSSSLQQADGTGTIMVCHPVVMTSTTPSSNLAPIQSPMAVTGQSNVMQSQVVGLAAGGGNQVRLQPKPRPQITGRQQIFFRVRRPTVPLNTTTVPNIQRYQSTPRGGGVALVRAGPPSPATVAVRAAPLLATRQQPVVGLRGLQQRQIRPALMMKSSNLSLISPDQLPDLPLDIQEKIVQFSGSSSSQNTSEARSQAAANSGVSFSNSPVISSPARAAVMVNRSPINQFKQQQTAPSNMAIVRPQQLLQQQLNAVAVPTQVVLRPQLPTSNNISQQLLVRPQHPQQATGTISLAIPVSAFKHSAIASASLANASGGLATASAGFSAASAGSVGAGNNVQFLTAVKPGSYTINTSTGLQTSATGLMQGPMQVAVSAYPGQGGIQNAAIVNQGGKESSAKVMVPWGWKRILINNAITYFSPSGIQLKCLEDVKEYLLAEGTCKCGLDCPFQIQDKFDFNSQKAAEVVKPLETGAGGSSRSSDCVCQHELHTKSLAQLHANTGLTIRHLNNPLHAFKDGKKRKVKKKKPFAGVLVSEMLAAREAEKNRINEIIAREKALHEAKRRQNEVDNNTPPTQEPPIQSQALRPQQQQDMQQQQQRIILPQHPLPQQILMQQVTSQVSTNQDLQKQTNQEVILQHQPMISQNVLSQQPLTSELSTNQGLVYTMASTNQNAVYSGSSTNQDLGYTISTSPNQNVMYATAATKGQELIMQPQQYNLISTNHQHINNQQPQSHLISEAQINPNFIADDLSRNQQMKIVEVDEISAADHGVVYTSYPQVEPGPSNEGLVQIEVPLPEMTLHHEGVLGDVDEVVSSEESSTLVGLAQTELDDNSAHEASSLSCIAEPMLAISTSPSTFNHQTIQLPCSQTLSHSQSFVSQFEPGPHHESFAPPEQLLDDDIEESYEVVDDNSLQIESMPSDLNVQNNQEHESLNENHAEENDDFNRSPSDRDDQDDYQSAEEQEYKEDSEATKTRESLPTPTRSTLPGMIVPSGLMSLSSAANIFRAESMSSKSSSRRSSVDGGTPSTPQHQNNENTNPRAFSLADAMQAARKLNMDSKAAANKSIASDNLTAIPTPPLPADIEDKNVDNEAEDDNVEEEERESNFNDGDEEIGDSNQRTHDLARNTEIRRMSTTEDGNKVLEPSFHSPEKTEGAKKNPLQNMLNIVSEMEVPNENLDASNESALQKPKGRKRLQYSLLNPALPLPGQAPTWKLMSGTSMTTQSTPTNNVTYIQAGALPQASQQQVIVAASPQQAPQQQQVMQLVQTINGPVLVPVGYQTVLPAPATQSGGATVALFPNASQQLHQGSSISKDSTVDESSGSSPSSSPASSNNTSPNNRGKTRSSRKRKVSGEMQNSGGNQVISVAAQQQPPSIMQQSNALSPNIVITSGVGGNQMMLQAVQAQPAPQGIIYQQLADGRMIQLQGPPQLPLIQTGTNQQVLPASNQLIISNPVQAQQPAQYIMTQQGLVQAVQPAQLILPAAHSADHQLMTDTQDGGGSKNLEINKLRNNTANVEDHGNTDHESQEDDYAKPSTSRTVLSPSTASIQSNKVDSSGLNATPPHNREAVEYEQLRDSGDSYSTHMNESMNSSIVNRDDTRMNMDDTDLKREEKESDDDSDSESDKAVSSSAWDKAVSLSKNKRQKQDQDQDNSAEGSLSNATSPIQSQPRQFQEGEIVWGPVEGHASWPGKVVQVLAGDNNSGVENGEEGMVLVCWYGGRNVSQVKQEELLTLSEGLDAHHKERKKIRRGRRMNESLEKAIQEAMMELD